MLRPTERNKVCKSRKVFEVQLPILRAYQPVSKDSRVSVVAGKADVH
jgi:hypothetical protein